MMYLYHYGIIKDVHCTPVTFYSHRVDIALPSPLMKLQEHSTNVSLGKSILQVPDTGTRVLDNTGPFLRSSIVSF